jgi:hypothetical protein
VPGLRPRLAQEPGHPDQPAVREGAVDGAVVRRAERLRRALERAQAILIRRRAEGERMRLERLAAQELQRGGVVRPEPPDAHTFTM